MNTHDYDDIIHLQHPELRHHQRMSMLQRAAQFAPFAALAGHNEAVQETASEWQKEFDLPKEQDKEWE